jgi:catechol 2,3-dioxygenase-like lactoylglutathione lyase family enzyme
LASLKRLSMNNGQRVVECIIPILNVQDLSASLEFSGNVLGFRRDWLHRKDWYAIAGISRDNCSIYLCEGDQGNPGTWIGVEDVHVLYEDYKAKQATIVQAPTNYSWGCEMRVRDPDGHILRIASETLPNVPLND